MHLAPGIPVCFFCRMSLPISICDAVVPRTAPLLPLQYLASLIIFISGCFLYFFILDALVSLGCARIGTGIDRELIGVFCCFVAKPGIFVYFPVVQHSFTFLRILRGL
jgi:hypothetical protein